MSGDDINNIIEITPPPFPSGTKINISSSLASIEFLPIPETEVDHPTHYQGKTLEVIDIIEDFDLDFLLGNAIKYILRAGKKNDLTKDLRKAIWYLERKCEKTGDIK